MSLWNVKIILWRRILSEGKNGAAEIYFYLFDKIEWFIDFSATNKIDNLTCVIIHDNFHNMRRLS